VYFVDERFGYGTVEEFARGSRESERLVSGKVYRRYIKRPLDVVASMIGLVLLSPLFLVLAIMVKLDSRGPVFFKQMRVGKGAREFEFYKFRSMVQDAEQMKNKLMHLNELEGPVFKISDDPRITSSGSFLRRTSLDELPQLFNVLRGDMSRCRRRSPTTRAGRGRS